MTFYRASLRALHEGPLDLPSLLARARMGEKSPALAADIQRALLRSGRTAFAEMWQGGTREVIEAFLRQYYSGDFDSGHRERHPLVDALAIYAWQSDRQCQEVDHRLSSDPGDDGYAVTRLANYMCRHIEAIAGEPVIDPLDQVMNKAIDSIEASGLSVDHSGMGETSLYGPTTSPWWVLLNYYPPYPHAVNTPEYREDEYVGWMEGGLGEQDMAYSELGLSPVESEMQLEWRLDDAYRNGVPQNHLFDEIVRGLDGQGPWWISKESFARMPKALGAAMDEFRERLIEEGRAEARQILDVNRNEIRQAGRDAGADEDEDEDEDY